jgi:hypothetical protein
MSLRHFALAAVLGFVAFASSSSATADTYYRCPTGYTFSVDPNGGPTAARCFKPASYDYQMITAKQHCAPTLMIAQDRLTNPAGKDQCINSNGSVQINPNCGGGGWAQEARPGPDRCRKLTPAATTFPNVPVQR